MNHLRFVLIFIVCACAVAHNVQRREEHNHPLSNADNSTHHRVNSTNPVADNSTVSLQHVNEDKTIITRYDGATVEDWSWVLRKLQKELKLNSSAPNPKKRFAESANRRAEPGCCG